MGRERTWLRLGGALVAVGLTAVGCSDADGEPTPTSGPTVSESPSEAPSSPEPTSPAPGPTPWPEPTRPAAMERDDVEGAKAAAEYFLAFYPYVYVTGDLGQWNALSHPECEFCASVEANVQTLHSDGGYSDGPTLTVLGIDGAPPDASYGYFSVWVDVEEGPHSYYDREGAETEQYDGDVYEVDMALTRDASGWIVRGVTVRESETHA